MADAQATLQLPPDLRLSAEPFAAGCAASPQAVLELSADGHLIHMTPTGSESSARNQTLGAPIWWWSWPAPVMKALRPHRPAPQDGRLQGQWGQLGWLLFPEQQAVEIWQP